MWRWGLLGIVMCAACGGSDLFSAGGTTTTTSTTTGGTGSTSTSGDGGAGGTAATFNPGGGGLGGQPGQGGQGGTQSTGGQGDPCNWDGEPSCDEGLYCDAPGCAAGTCQPRLDKAQQQKQLDPQCGCDGITFYNASIAQSYAMSVKHPGECDPNQSKKCKPKPDNCGPDYRCKRQVNDFGQCIFAPQDDPGRCWAVPLSCDPNLGPQGKTCLGNPFCSDVCSLIQSQNPWFQDFSCK